MTHTTLMSFVTIVFLASFSAGCVKVDTPKEVNIGGPGRYDDDRYEDDYYEDDRYYEKDYDDRDDAYYDERYGDDDRRRPGLKNDKDDAYRIAKRIARDEGILFREYEIHDRETDVSYWVLFERKRPLGRDWANHFTIRVPKRGRDVRMYRGRPVGRIGRGDVGEGDARRAADQVALEMGVNPRDYQVEHKSIMKNDWFVYENKRDWDGRRNFFAVRVSRNSRLSLYGD